MEMPSRYNTPFVQHAQETCVVSKAYVQHSLWQPESDDAKGYIAKNKLQTNFKVRNQYKLSMKSSIDANDHQVEEEYQESFSEELEEQEQRTITFVSEGYDEVNLIPEVQPVRRTSYNARSILRYGHYYNRELIELPNGQYWEPYHSAFTFPVPNDGRSNTCQQSTRLSSNHSNNNSNIKAQKQKRINSTRQQQQEHNKHKSTKEHLASSRKMMQQNKSNLFNVCHHSREEEDNLCVVCLHYTDNTHVKVRHMPLQSWQTIRDCSEVIACTPHRPGLSSQHLILPSHYNTSSSTLPSSSPLSSPSLCTLPATTKSTSIAVKKKALMTLSSSPTPHSSSFQPFCNSVLPEAMQRSRYEQRNVLHITSYEEVMQFTKSKTKCKSNKNISKQSVSKCANYGSANSNFENNRCNVNTITFYKCNGEQESLRQEESNATTENINIHMQSVNNVALVVADQVTIIIDKNSIREEINACDRENGECNSVNCVNDLCVTETNQHPSENVDSINSDSNRNDENSDIVNHVSNNNTESEEDNSENRQNSYNHLLNNNRTNKDNNDEPNVFDYFTMPPSRIAAIRQWKHASFSHYMQHKMLYNNYILRCIEREDRRAFLANERREIFLRCLQRDVQHRLNNDELYVVGRELPEELVQMFFILNDFGPIESSHSRRRHYNHHHHYHHYHSNNISRRNFGNTEQLQEENDNSQQEEEQEEEEESERLVAHNDDNNDQVVVQQETPVQSNLENMVSTSDINNNNNNVNTETTNDDSDSDANTNNDHYNTGNNTRAPVNHTGAESESVRSSRARRRRSEREQLRNNNINRNSNNTWNRNGFFSLDISNARWEDNLLFPGQRPVNGYVIVTASPAGIAEDEVGIDEPIDYGTANYIPRTDNDTNVNNMTIDNVECNNSKTTDNKNNSTSTEK